MKKQLALSLTLSRTLLLTLALTLSLMPFCFADNTAVTSERATEEEISRYTSLSDIDFSAYRLVMVNYWEPWCGSCKMEMPDLSKLYEEYKDRGLLIAGFHHETDDLEEALEEVGELSYPLVHYINEDEFPDSPGVPVTVFYDSEGNVLLPTLDELYRGVLDELEELVETVDAADPAEVDADYLAYAESLKDEEAMEKEAMTVAESYFNSCKVGFLGSASYEIWKERIETRLPE